MSDKLKLKTSDLIFNINNSISNIELLIQNIDFTNKLILQKLSEKNSVDTGKPYLEKVIPAEITAPPSRKINTHTLKKVTVQQKIIYSNDKPVVLAKVKIFDSDKKEIKELLTNHSGKWNISLEPGSYFVHILKPELPNKPKIDKYFPIEVNDSKTSLDLDLIKV